MHCACGELLPQAARLECGGVAFAVAVIADGQPTSGYGVATMRGVGARMLPQGGPRLLRLLHEPLLLRQRRSAPPPAGQRSRRGETCYGHVRRVIPARGTAT
jgi:hypothetical protein